MTFIFNIFDFDSNTTISIENSVLSLTYDETKWYVEPINSTDVFAAGSLNLSVSIAVPEPSTYAMIFGALALGLAVYRRPK